jgi:hypothetical protein
MLKPSETVYSCGWRIEPIDWFISNKLGIKENHFSIVGHE